MEQKPAPLTPEIQCEKKYLIEEENKKYDIFYKLNPSLISIVLIDNNSFPQMNYEGSFSFEDIRNKSKIFKIYDTLKEIFDNLILFMDKKKYLLKINYSNAIIIFNLDIGNFQFELPIKKNNIEDSINYLTEKVKFLLEENKEIKNKINILEQELSYFRAAEKEKNDDQLFNDSTIIQSKDEKNLISNWILQNTKKITKLLFKAKRDGDKASDFHSKCDNMGPTVTIIQTTTGERFGGYTSKNWTTPPSFIWPGDALAFVFSLNLKEKFPIKIADQAIGHYNNKGPVFGYGHCIDISSGCLDNSSSYHATSGSYEGTGDQIKLTKEKNFTVADYEVFQIKFQ